ncbi:MAG: C-terminal binding protein [Bryobacterales bacterium]|nr:C-terminal binding protein [Bryobacterales bacterium]
MALKKVIVTDSEFGSLVEERKILAGVADLLALPADHEEELNGQLLAEADAFMVYHTMRITEKTLRRLTKCRFIVRCGVGYDNIDHALARTLGMDVANVPDYGTEEVADSAIGLMLSLTRGINLLNLRLRDAAAPWTYTHPAPLRRLRGRQYSVIGLGRIGTAAAMRAKALGMDVAFYDPYKADGYDKSLGIRRVESLAELLATSYVVSMHCPLTADTRGIINAATLAQLPRGSYLVNTSRGAVVDTSAIPDALASGQLAGAGIDVLEHEPPDVNDPLLRAWRDPSHAAYERLILNSHCAFYSEQGLADMHRKGTEACRRALLGQTPRNIVNAASSAAD